MRLASMCAVLGALASLIPAARADEWNKRWSVGAKPELRIFAGDAAVTVEGTERDQIEAVATTRGWKIGPSGVQVNDRQVGNRVEIEIRVPTMHISFGMHSVRLEVRVPRELTADIHTGDGSITLRELHGPLRVDTGDGSIQAEDLDGSLDAHTGDGSVRVSGRFDAVRLHTQDGSVELEAMRGSRMQSEWRVQTGDGSVRLSLPSDLAADMELRTGDGRIHTNLPITVNGMQSEHELHGKLNGGGQLLSVRTGDGSITVSSS